MKASAELLNSKWLQEDEAEEKKNMNKYVFHHIKCGRELLLIACRTQQCLGGRLISRPSAGPLNR
jgi:hypothetical protein